MLLLRRHRRFEDPDYAGSTDDAWKRQRNAEPVIVATDWYYRPLIAKNHFRDSGCNIADAKLTRVVAFDDDDIRVTNVTSIFLRISRTFRRALQQACQSVRRRSERLTKQTPAKLGVLRSPGPPPDWHRH